MGGPSYLALALLGLWLGCDPQPKPGAGPASGHPRPATTSPALGGARQSTGGGTPQQAPKGTTPGGPPHRAPAQGLPGAQSQATGTAAPERFRFLRPPPRQPGPARRETPAQLKRVQAEAERFVSSLLAAQYSRREITSMADIRGYQLYLNRYVASADLWFREAIRADPSFELSLFNGARTAALLGQRERAAQLIESLRKLDTPLARARLALAEQDPDFGQLRPPIREK